MPFANSSGKISYHRVIELPRDIAKKVSNLHVVVHGADLPGDDDHTSLNSLFEATLPVACGQIN